MRFAVIILGLLTLLLHNWVSAQDIHFTQFQAAPLTLNPALTGHFKGDYRITNIHRRQWASISTPFVTNAIAYDRPVYFYRETLAAGAVWVHDQSGFNRLIVNKLLLSVAYRKKYKRHLFAIGFQGGPVRKNTDLSTYSFPDQFDRNNGTFNSGAPTAEPLSNEPITYLDLNVGVIWSSKFGSFEPEVGWAIYHFNQPNESFYGQDFNLPYRQVTSVGGQIHINGSMRVKPQLLYMSQQRASDLLVGGAFEIDVPANDMRVSSMYAGILFRDGFQRNSDAFALQAGLDVGEITAGVSYDINISELQVATNSRGAIELYVTYRSPSTLLKRNALPCDRF